MRIAVDIGNTRIQFGIRTNERSLQIFSKWQTLLAQVSDEPIHWDISSVNPRRTQSLLQKIQTTCPDSSIRVLNWKDVPIPINVDFPEKVGMDRILAAYAVQRWKERLQSRLKAPKPGFLKRPFLICDLGTANTYDLLSAVGVFEGGAIEPGLDLAAKSLNAGTALLPDISHSQSSSEIPTYPGKNTEQAIASGIFWGTLGTIRQLIDLLKKTTSYAPVVVVAGGNAKIVQASLSYPSLYFPNLVLRGIFELER